LESQHKKLGCGRIPGLIPSRATGPIGCGTS
jgi:hypothetical protein